MVALLLIQELKSSTDSNIFVRLLPGNPHMQCSRYAYWVSRSAKSASARSVVPSRGCIERKREWTIPQTSWLETSHFSCLTRLIHLSPLPPTKQSSMQDTRGVHTTFGSGVLGGPSGSDYQLCTNITALYTCRVWSTPVLLYSAKARQYNSFVRVSHRVRPCMNVRWPSNHLAGISARIYYPKAYSLKIRMGKALIGLTVQ